MIVNVVKDVQLFPKWYDFLTILETEGQFDGEIDIDFEYFDKIYQRLFQRICVFLDIEAQTLSKKQMVMVFFIHERKLLGTSIHFIQKVTQNIIIFDNLKFIRWKIFDTYEANVPDHAVKFRILQPTTLFSMQQHLQHLYQYVGQILLMTVSKCDLR